MPSAGTFFFLASKTLGFFAVPSNTIGFLGLAGLLLMPTRFTRAGRRLLVLCVLGFVLCGLSPFGRLILLPLEQRFPPWNPAAGAPTGIIVLGGSVNGRISEARGVAVLDQAAERMTAAVELARRYPQARLIYSGGSGNLIDPGMMEATVARRLFTDLGVSPERIEIEDRSRNTAENAEFTNQIAQPKPGERWLLVTSAAHMPRSVGIFRRVGFPVEPYPVGWRTSGQASDYFLSTKMAEGLSRTDTAAREWVGLLIYWLTDRTSELFPGPQPGCDLGGADRCRP